jgi:hypothetical protein
LATYYLYSFFFGNGSIGQLGWGVILGIFSWFNYWALISFRNAHLNMKKFYDSQKPIKEEVKQDEEENLFDD